MARKAWERVLVVAFAPALFALLVTGIERAVGSAPLQSEVGAIGGHFSGVVCIAAMASLCETRLRVLYGIVGWIYGVFAFVVHVVVAHEGIEEISILL